MIEKELCKQAQVLTEGASARPVHLKHGDVVASVDLIARRVDKLASFGVPIRVGSRMQDVGRR